MPAHLRVVGDGAASFDHVADAFLGEKTAPTTRAAYEADLRHFARYFSQGDSNELTASLAVRLYAADAGRLAAILTGYKTDLLREQAAPSTINRRLACVRSLLVFARKLGECDTDPRGLVTPLPRETIRDTRGVSVLTMRKLIALPEKLPLEASGKPSVKALRDTAILRLFCENGLRRAEIAQLAYGDFDASARRLLIRGKGRAGQQEAITLSPKSVSALRAYLRAAGHRFGPLFRNVSHRPEHNDGGLTDNGIYRLVVAYGAQIGVRLAPHKLRHSAITAVLSEVGGDVRRAQEFSRHRDVRTLFVYDDRRKDSQGRITRALSRRL